MLELTIMDEDLYDEVEEIFIQQEIVRIQLEHSLVSVSKWESKWEKPFLDKAEKTPEEILDYVGMMIISGHSPDLLNRLSKAQFEAIDSYMNSTQSATTFADVKKPTNNREKVSSELIYYWMLALNIPIECETWHLNRLFSLIKIANLKNNPPKKMSRKELMERNRQLNAQRKVELGTKG